MQKNYPAAVQKSAAVISKIFNPLISLLFFFAYYSLMHYTPAEVADKFLPVISIVVLPTGLWIFYNVKSGNYADSDVSNRRKRRGLYTFMAVSFLAYFIYNYVSKGDMDVRFVFLTVLLIALQLSNYFVKSSMHTAFNLFTAALFSTENISLAIGWLFITIAVALSRIVLGRHSVKEVAFGGGIGLIVSVIYCFTAIQLLYKM